MTHEERSDWACQALHELSGLEVPPEVSSELHRVASQGVQVTKGTKAWVENALKDSPQVP